MQARFACMYAHICTGTYMCTFLFFLHALTRTHMHCQASMCVRMLGRVRHSFSVATRLKRYHSVLLEKVPQCVCARLRTCYSLYVVAERRFSDLRNSVGVPRGH